MDRGGGGYAVSVVLHIDQRSFFVMVDSFCIPVAVGRRADKNSPKNNLQCPTIFAILHFTNYQLGV